MEANLKTYKVQKNRLKIAVPIALVLIFILLYFAFKSIKEALLIFSAIPLSAVGGVLFLWLRDMPFSISAGVGFIALFGIAVLNGIVLIEHFKELKSQGVHDLETRIRQGTKDRLRAVLLTASAAALGFLPMAISTSAGAEVQRPLATVVIGGLITATLLTLIVLPVLYSLFETKITMKKIKQKKHGVWIVVLVAFSGFMGMAQNKAMGLDEIRALAFEQNASLKAAALSTQKSEALLGSSFSFDKTTIYYQYDQNNLAFNNEPLNVFGIQQSFLFPTVYFANKRIQKSQLAMENSRLEIRKQKLERELRSSYYHLTVCLGKRAGICFFG